MLVQYREQTTNQMQIPLNLETMLTSQSPSIQLVPGFSWMMIVSFERRSVTHENMKLINLKAKLERLERQRKMSFTKSVRSAYCQTSPSLRQPGHVSPTLEGPPRLLRPRLANGDAFRISRASMVNRTAYFDSGLLNASRQSPSAACSCCRCPQVPARFATRGEMPSWRFVRPMKDRGALVTRDRVG